MCLLPCEGNSEALLGLMCSAQGARGLLHGISEASRGPVLASATKWEKAKVVGAPDTASSSQTVQHRERSFPQHAFWGWIQRNSATFNPMSLQGTAGVPCLLSALGSRGPLPHRELRVLEVLGPGPFALGTPRGGQLKLPLGFLRTLPSCRTRVQSPVESTHEGTDRRP